jgi:hypothetical protein
MPDSAQLTLPLPRKPQAVDVETVRRQPSMTKALTLCADLAGFVNDKDLCRVLDIDQPVWARIKSAQANFPHDKLNDLMDEAGNEVPLIWLADRRGYILTPKESEMEKRLRMANERAARAEERERLLTEILQGRASK